MKQEHSEAVAKPLKMYESFKTQGLLLSLEFTTLADYLHLLKATTVALSQCQKSAMLYLAAAVSDFYIPAKEMVNLMEFTVSLFIPCLTFLPKICQDLFTFFCCCLFSQSTKFSRLMDH